METKREIDLKQIGFALLKKLWLICLCAVIVAGAAFAYTKVMVKPQYQAKISIYVNNTNAGQVNGISSSDLATSQRLVQTYINILKSDRVLDAVIGQLNLNISAGALRGMISTDNADGTEVFTVKVTDYNAARARDIANAIADVAPTVIADIVEGSSTKVIDRAKTPGSPCAPNSTRNGMVGGAVGAMAVCVLVVLRTLLDVRVKDEEDLARICQAPVLGNIPDFNTQVKGGYSYTTEQPYSTNKGVGV